MRHALALCAIVLAAGVAAASGVQAEALRLQLKVQEELLAEQVAELASLQESLQEAWVRVSRQSSDHLRAQEQNEGLDGLRLRDSDLRQAETELLMDLLEAQRLRRSIVDTRALVEKSREELKLLEAAGVRRGDPLSGTWTVVLEPGGQEGRLYLQLDGTLVQGTYELDGGWFGSLRGTLVAGKVRLERVDSQLGFAAILYGRLVVEQGSFRLVGSWEATQLASGLPSAGSWLAERVEE